jgi:hypothetical protein
MAISDARRNDMIMSPRVQALIVAVSHALKALCSLELKQLEDHDGSEPSSINGLVTPQLLTQLRCLPKHALVVGMIVALRLISTFNAVSDACIDELLHGRTMISKVCLATAVLPGWLTLHYFRHDLLEESMVTSLDGRHEAQLIRNLRRMPPVFWFTTWTSSAVTLHVVKRLSVHIVQSILRLRWRVAFSLIVAGAAAAIAPCRDHQKEGIERFPPIIAGILSTAWYQSQVVSRAVFASLFAHFEDKSKHRHSHKQCSMLLQSPEAGHSAMIVTSSGALSCQDSEDPPLFRGRGDAASDVANG